MPSAAKQAQFDPAVGSTIDVGIDDASVPDVTHYMKETAYISIMTPQGNPMDPKCIWGAPVVYWGLPSTAKSEQTEQAAIEANLPYATIFPGQRQPEDFAGVLVPYASGVVIECMLGAVRQLNAIGRGVIFLDEINNATRATEGAMLGFIQKRIVGDVPIAPGIRIISAANPPKWSVNGFQMAPPTANRFCHFQVKCPPLDRWCEHMINEDVGAQFDAGGTEDHIRAHWGNIYGYVKGLLIGYMRSSPCSLHHEPDPDHPQSGFGWGSPRSWKQAARMVATAKILGYKKDIIDLVIQGCVGEGLAGEFDAWVRNADLPTPEEVLIRGWSPDPRRLDVAYAVLASTTQYIVSTIDPQEAIQKAIGGWNLLNKFVQADMGDMTISAAQTLIHRKLSRKDSPAIAVAADPVVTYLKDNGLLVYAARA